MTCNKCEHFSGFSNGEGPPYCDHPKVARRTLDEKAKLIQVVEWQRAIPFPSHCPDGRG